MKHRNWTRKDEQFLIDKYCDYTNDELANLLERTNISIKTRARELGLTKAVRSELKSKIVDRQVTAAKPKPKPKFKSYYEPTSINAIRQTYGINV